MFGYARWTRNIVKKHKGQFMEQKNSFYCDFNKNSLWSGSLLLAFVQSQKRNVGHLHHLETNTGNISHSVSLTPESCHQNLIVFLKHREKAHTETSADISSNTSHMRESSLPQWSSSSRRWGRKRWSSCRSWSVGPGRTSWWQSWAAWLQHHCQWQTESVIQSLVTPPFITVLTLTLSQAQCLWREKLHRRGWPSERCPNGPSCTVYRAISERGGGSAVF